jgi:hypothetical protein
MGSPDFVAGSTLLRARPDQLGIATSVFKGLARSAIRWLLTRNRHASIAWGWFRLGTTIAPIRHNVTRRRNTGVSDTSRNVTAIAL